MLSRHVAADAQSDASAIGKELIALSIRAFGDNPLGWRYPATLFGALAIVAIYLCGLALFAAQGPAIAAALIAGCNQMLYVQARIAMLEFLHSASACSAIAAFMTAFERTGPIGCSRLPAAVRLACGLQMERPVSARNLHRHRRGDPPDAGLAHPVCRREAEGLVPARSLARFQVASLRALLHRPARGGISCRASSRSTACRCRIWSRRSGGSLPTTPRLPSPVTLYMSAWPSWPLLVRPVWFLFDKIADDNVSAIVCLGNPLVLWPALLALAVVLRDFVVCASPGCLPDRGLLFRVLARLGVAAADARLHLLLSAGRDCGVARAGLRAAPGRSATLAVVGLCRGRGGRLCRHAADLGGLRRHIDADSSTG